MEIHEDYQKQLKLAEQSQKANKKLVGRLKKAKTKKLDQEIHDLHEEAFEEIDCLNCANCCKTTSPIFRDIDIERLSKHLGMKAADFVSEYLLLDSVGDYVLKSSPCPFLDADNYCSVYEYRPKACREYPHTDRKNQQQILDLAYRNTLVCPAVSWIFEGLKSRNY